MTSPGNPNWVRNLVELIRAQREPLVTGADRTPTLDAAHWQGRAGDGYATTRHALATAWRSAVHVHQEVADRVDGYAGFVHELPHLWAGANLQEQARLHILWRDAADRLARDLINAAADLDRLTVPEPDTVQTPPAPAFPDPRAESEPPDTEPGPDPVATFPVTLREQILNGTRLNHLQWTWRSRVQRHFAPSRQR